MMTLMPQVPLIKDSHTFRCLTLMKSYECHVQTIPTGACMHFKDLIDCRAKLTQI